FAVVPAAGRSRRMGADKQLLDVHGRPMLRAVVENLAAAPVAGIMVVTHSKIAAALGLETLPEIGAKLVRVALNDDESSTMIDSMRIGLEALSHRRTFRDDDGYLVCPGDQPDISTADFERCIAAYRAAPDRIVIASRDGKHGHPMIFPATLAEFVKSS